MQCIHTVLANLTNLPFSHAKKVTFFPFLLFAAASQRYTLRVKQHTPPTPGQSNKMPLLIPLAVGLLGPDGVCVCVYVCVYVCVCLCVCVCVLFAKSIAMNKLLSLTIPQSIVH